MAGKPLTYKRTKTDKVTIKGVLSEDATVVTILVEDENKQKIEKDVKIKDYLDNFIGESVEIIISNKTEEDLCDSPTSEDEE